MHAEFRGQEPLHARIHEPPVQPRGDGALLDRVPGHHDALRPARRGVGQRLGDPREVGVGLLVGRVDEREPALLARRQERAERLEPVAGVDAEARVAAELAPERIGLRGLQFAERRAVVRAHQRRRDQRRAGVGARASPPAFSARTSSR